MKRRGRPPYPGILTPRQQEVLALLREGLTNPQIAERLDISLDGAKFLVGEVIGRLGVADRAAAAPVPTSRLAWAFAPFALLRRITPSWLPPAVSGAVIVAVLAGVGVLTWAVVSTGGGGAHVVAPTATAGPAPVARTGIPALDATIDKLVRQDVNGLLDLVQFEDIGCSVEQTVGSPPPCPTGVADGTPLQAFPLSQCEGYYATTIDGVNQAFGNALSRQPSANVYAVLRGNGTNHTGYTVVITPDQPSLATAPSSFWYLSDAGKVTGLLFECGALGAAQQVAYRFPNPDFISGPFNNCSPGPGEFANLLITVETWGGGGTGSQFAGPAKTTLEVPTGERAVVTVTAATRWIGRVTRMEDLRGGEVLQAVGGRQPDCTILAEDVLSESSGTPVTGPPTSGTIDGQVIQGVDGNGAFSLPDTPARTLIQLAAATRTYSLYTAPEGSFRITGVSDGTYTVRIWWLPGFENLSADATNAGLVSLPVSVDIKADQPVSLTMPETIFVKPETSGVLPFPANEADAAGPNIATGALDLQAGGR